jgi:hypothetical protein
MQQFLKKWCNWIGERCVFVVRSRSDELSKGEKMIWSREVKCLGRGWTVDWWRNKGGWSLGLDVDRVLF